MKRILAALVPLTFAALFLPTSTPAQDVDVRVKVRQPRATVTLPPPSYRPPAAYAPPVAGTGCRGYTATGCRGVAASYGAGCYGSRAVGGCVGTYGASCYGRAAGTYGSGCYGRTAYGAPRGDGTFATPSGRPAPPSILPWNGPLVGTVRWLSGYDPLAR